MKKSLLASFITLSLLSTGVIYASAAVTVEDPDENNAVLAAADNLTPEEIAALARSSSMIDPVLYIEPFQETALLRPVSEGGAKYLMILGDSISTGYGLADKDKESYGAIIASKLGYTEDTYGNIAVDGMNSGDLLTSLKLLFESNPDGGSADETEAILISIGGNDFLEPLFVVMQKSLGLSDTSTDTEIKNAVLANPTILTTLGETLAKPENTSLFTDAATQFSKNLNEIVALLKNGSPLCEIYIQTVYNPFSGVPGFEAVSSFADTMIGTLNADITAGAATGAYKVVDVAGALNGEAATLTNITSFDIHPNAAGHKVIADLFTELPPAPIEAAVDSTITTTSATTATNPETGVSFPATAALLAAGVVLVSKKRR